MNEIMEKTLSQMRAIRITSIAAKLEEMAADPNFSLRSADDVLAELFAYEYNKRMSKRIQDGLKNSNLKYKAATLDSTLNEPDRKIDVNAVNALSECKWIDSRSNLLITGKTGTGKTYLGCALGISAIHKSKSVLYTKASTMINNLSDLSRQGEYSVGLETYTKPELLIIDDFGLMSLDIERCLHMFEVLDAREGNGSVMVISQLPVKAWYELFKSNVYADSCLSRLTGKALRLELDGRDMRKS